MRKCVSVSSRISIRYAIVEKLSPFSKSTKASQVAAAIRHFKLLLHGEAITFIATTTILFLHAAVTRNVSLQQ